MRQRDVNENPNSGGGAGKLVVWDWKSSDKNAQNFVAKAKADFAKKHTGVTVEFVAQPFENYYTLLGAAIQAGKGPDACSSTVVVRSGIAPPLCWRWTSTSRRTRTDWRVGTRQQGRQDLCCADHPAGSTDLLQQEHLQAGRCRRRDAARDLGRVAQYLRHDQGEDQGALHLAGNKRGYGMQFWMSSMGSGILTSAEYDSSIAGKRDWNSANVKKIFATWKEAGDAG